MNEEDQAPPPPASSGSADPGLGGAAEISRRVGSILDAVEREAAQLRDEARGDAGRYLEHAKRRADGLVAERQRRIAEISDELLTKAEAVVARLDDAAPVRQGFENLVRALGDAAERLSHETAAGGADFEPQPYRESAAAPAPRTEPPPAPAPAEAPPRYEGAPAYPPPPPAYAEPFPPAPPAPPPPPAPGDGLGSYDGFPAQPHPARSPEGVGWQAQQGAPAQPPGGRLAPGSAGWRELDNARMVAIQMAATGATRASVREHLHRGLGVADTAGVLDEIFGANTGEDATVPWTARPR